MHLLICDWNVELSKQTDWLLITGELLFTEQPCSRNRFLILKLFRLRENLFRGVTAAVETFCHQPLIIRSSLHNLFRRYPGWNFCRIVFCLFGRPLMAFVTVCLLLFFALSFTGIDKHFYLPELHRFLPPFQEELRLFRPGAFDNHITSGCFRIICIICVIVRYSMPVDGCVKEGRNGTNNPMGGAITRYLPWWCLYQTPSWE